MPYITDITIVSGSYDPYFGNSGDTGLGVILTPSTLFTTTFNRQLNLQIFENLRILLSTRKGERYGQPTYGTNLYNVLFQPSTDTLKDAVQSTIRDAVDEWLPYISLDRIDVKTAEDDPDNPNFITVRITYSVQNFGTNEIVVYVNEFGSVEITPP
jgi:phage baseplate assembly protein W